MRKAYRGIFLENEKNHPRCIFWKMRKSIHVVGANSNSVRPNSKSLISHSDLCPLCGVQTQSLLHA